MQVAIFILAGMCFLIWLSPLIYRGRKGFFRFHGGMEWEDRPVKTEKKLKPWKEEERMRRIGERTERWK